MHLIFKQGDNSYNSFIEGAQVLEASVNNEASVTQNPTEEGSFTSVNKTVNPRSVSVQLAVSGTQAQLGQASALLEQYVRSTQLFVVLTPEGRYKNMNLINYSATRTGASAVNMLNASLEFQEIRQVQASYKTVTASNRTTEVRLTPMMETAIRLSGGYSPKSAGDASMVDTGKQQTRELTAKENAVLYEKLSQNMSPSKKASFLDSMNKLNGGD